MTLRSRQKLGLLLIGVALFAVSAPWALGTVADNHVLSTGENIELARLTNGMQAVCVGRFVIDLPKEAEYELGQARIDGIELTGFKETPEEFEKRLSDREAQIKATPDYLGGDKNLESVRTVKTQRGLIGKVFVHSRTVTEGTYGDGLEVKRYRDEGITVEGMVHGQGVSIDLSAVGRGLAWIEDIPELVAKLVVNPDNRVPAEPGFCLDRAYVRDPLSVEQREAITMFARLPKHPDIGMSLIVAAGLKPDEQGLLERSAAAKSLWPLADRKRIKERRAAPKNIHGLIGDELVESILERDDLTVHSFWWEVNGTRDDILVPHVVFRMHAGSGGYKPLPSSLSLAAATALWDKVLSSFRLLAKEPGVAPLPNRRKASESRRDAAAASIGS